MLQIILVLHVVISIAMIALVMVQQGKGADMGASFGSGASNTVFGSSGHTPFLVKLTVVFVVIFFLTSLSIGVLTIRDKKANANVNRSNSLLSQPVVPVPVSASMPVMPSPKKEAAVKGPLKKQQK